jgi:hypothetical protein
MCRVVCYLSMYRTTYLCYLMLYMYVKSIIYAMYVTLFVLWAMVYLLYKLCVL